MYKNIEDAMIELADWKVNLRKSAKNLLVEHKIEFVRSSGQGNSPRVEFGFSHHKRLIVSNMSAS